MLRKILSFYTQFFAIWVVVFAVVAYVVPAPFVWMQPAMEWFFALTMFGIGAVLQVEDFRRVAMRPMVIFVGSSAQFLLMPFGSYLFAKAYGLSAEATVGLILTGSAPGAMASNVMSYIARADAAYSVSLTTVSTLLCPLLTPGLTFILAGSVLRVPFAAMVLSVLKMVILPLLAGFAVRYYFNKRIEKILEVFPAISVTFIIFICSLVIALNRDYLAGVTALILAAAVTLNIYGMVTGYLVGTAFRMEQRRRQTLAIEIGMQNAGLGTVLALKHFGAQAAVPAAVFVFVCIITASVMSALWQRQRRDSLTAQ